MSESIRVISSPVLSIFVSSGITSFTAEKRFPKDITIAELKNKLELVTGASSACMKLDVYSKEDTVVCRLDRDFDQLGSFPIDDGMRIHVTDSTVRKGEFDDISKVEKYEMTEDDYKKRSESLRAFKEKNKMGRFNPEEQAKIEEAKLKRDGEEKEKAEGIKVGDRCEIEVAGQMNRRGQVKYVGLTKFKDGYWIGIQYDEPVGKNNGSVQGEKYFDCMPKYGGFVKPQAVTVGDFPEENFDDEDEI